MLSKNNIKFINALQKKKFRQKYNKFLVEGDKMVVEILTNGQVKIHSIYAVQSWLTEHAPLLTRHRDQITQIDERELKTISSLTTPNRVLCILEIPNTKLSDKHITQNISLVLDNIQDPGNMGSILRTADWFGIDHVFCLQCVDVYNPKVVQATMGAFLRIHVIQTDAEAIFERWNELPVYGTFLDGENMYETELTQKGFIVIGNEGRGIRPEIESFITHKIKIPAYGKAESLNAAVATGIVCAEFRRNAPYRRL